MSNVSNEEYWQIIKAMEKLLEKYRESEDLGNRSLCSPSKEFLDNASKSSSGYDDEEEVEEDSSPYHVGVTNNGRTLESFIIISDDDDEDDHDEDGNVYYISSSEDDCDAWTVCSISDEDFYGFLDVSDSESSSSEDEPQKNFQVRHPLSLYPPSEEMKMANLENFSIKSIKNTNDLIGNYARNLKLNQENLRTVFKTLLEIEDITCLSEYPRLAQKNVMLKWTEKRDFWIPVPDTVLNIEDIVAPYMDELVIIPKESSELAASKPHKFLIDTLFPHPHEDELMANAIRRRIATIIKLSRTEVHFRFSEDQQLTFKQISSLATTKYDVIIRPRRLPLRYQYRALELLEYNEEVQTYLFPQINPLREIFYENKTELALLNKTIASNPEQLEAVKFLVEGPNPNAPYVIFGPPGTGKTTTIVESILQLRLHRPRSRILVTAGSNSACDTIALRICKYFNSNSQLQDIAKRDFEQQQKSILRIYSKTIVEKGLHLIEKELRDNSNVSTGVHYYPPVKEIRRYGIIVATLCTVGKLVTGDVGKMDFFSHIFIDEAGASTEPEALVGIMGIKSPSCRIVLSGDHKQLGPILKSERAIQLGLEKSLMERLLSSDCYAIDENCNYDRTIQARLKRNYRSHPEIVRLFNHLYYNDELIADAKMDDVNVAEKWCKLPNPNFPIIFQAVHGITEKDTTTPSCCNNLEMQVLMWFLQRLLVDGINGRQVDQSDIGIITPYRLQNKLIQSRLNARGWDRVESGSVETFQGREKQIIIVSLVRSFSGLGFVRNPKRLNVILSRPKSLLILMGNPSTFKRHPDFEFIMNECRRNGTFLRKKKTKKSKTN